MIVDIQTRRLRTIGQLGAFVEGNEAVDFQPRNRAEAYGFVRETLERFGYRRLGKRDKGVVLRFLVAATGISRQQMERLVRQWRETGVVRDRRGGGRGRPFVRKYTAVDIRLLADLDEAYGQMSGLTTREVLRRQHEVFGEARFERLAAISNGHVYNLRASATYRAKRTAWSKTQATTVAIGLRQAPEPEGRPGHVRVDTVHQGDRNGVKGIYLINLVETDRLRSAATQFEFVGAVVGISERFLLPLDGARERVPAIRALFLRPGAFDRRSLPTGYLATGASRVRFAERDASGPVPTTPPSPATNASTKRTASKRRPRP